MDFQNEIFIRKKTSDELWNDFIGCQISIYTKLPDIITLDREYSFTYDKFRENAKNMGVHVQFTCIEA